MTARNVIRHEQPMVLSSGHLTKGYWKMKNDMLGIIMCG
jgi:hypothetical protein